MVGDSTDLRNQIMANYHNSTVGEHSGIDKTTRRIKRTFYWKGLKRDVQHYISEHIGCQRFKGENVHTPGLLQPLPIPERVWSDLSMDFIEGLPRSQGKSTIFVVVDRLTKYAHFMALSHPYTTKDVAKLFLDNVYKLHGLPNTIVSDRDPIFTSLFWQELFKLMGTELCLSTAYHPQSDGQTEIVNKCLENYLMCMCGDCPKQWGTWLSLAEWWYNSSYHSSIKTTPYYAVYGWHPPDHNFMNLGSSTVAAVENWARARASILRMLKENLHQTQHRMKFYANKLRTESEFEEGDWVYLRLQPYRQSSLALQRNMKLSPRFYGPSKWFPGWGRLLINLSYQIQPNSILFSMSLCSKRRLASML